MNSEAYESIKGAFVGLIRKGLEKKALDIAEMNPGEVNQNIIADRDLARKHGFEDVSYIFSSKLEEIGEAQVNSTLRRKNKKRSRREDELEEYLSLNGNLGDVEIGLEYESRQFGVQNGRGRIDIRAKDREGNPVNIELKAEKYNSTEVLNQVSKYLNAGNERLIFVAPRIEKEFFGDLKEKYGDRISFYHVNPLKVNDQEIYSFSPVESGEHLPEARNIGKHIIAKSREKDSKKENGTIKVVAPVPKNQSYVEPEVVEETPEISNGPVVTSRGISTGAELLESLSSLPGVSIHETDVGEVRGFQGGEEIGDPSKDYVESKKPRITNEAVLREALGQIQGIDGNEIEYTESEGGFTVSLPGGQIFYEFNEFEEIRARLEENSRVHFNEITTEEVRGFHGGEEIKKGSFHEKNAEEDLTDNPLYYQLMEIMLPEQDRGKYLKPIKVSAEKRSELEALLDSSEVEAVIKSELELEDKGSSLESLASLMNNRGFESIGSKRANLLSKGCRKGVIFAREFNVLFKEYNDSLTGEFGNFYEQYDDYIRFSVELANVAERVNKDDLFGRYLALLKTLSEEGTGIEKRLGDAGYSFFSLMGQG